MLKKAINASNQSNQTSSVCVVVLPTKMQLHINVGLKSRGKEVISQVSQLLGTTDLHLFGLSFVKDNSHLFVDLEKKLITYFPKSQKRTSLPDRMVLHLRVQYYMSNGRNIPDVKVRSLYYADVKNRVLSSQCYEHEGVYFQLAAYALQAELGDWNDGKETSFTPRDYFPSWILKRRGCDFVVRHIPALHKELKGTSAHEASLLFIQEACNLSDVPLTFYSMSKGKKERRATVLLGLALTCLRIYELKIETEEYHLVYEFSWSTIDCIKFQGRRFEISADSVAGKVLVMYTQTVTHSQHLLQHISNSHRVHLQATHSCKQLQRQDRRQQKEVYIRSNSTESDSEDSEDDLPPLKSFLDEARQRNADIMEPLPIANVRDTAGGFFTKGKTDFGEIELCVDEPDEMSVDDFDEISQLTDLQEGVSVDGPPLVTASEWIDCTMEMKQVLRLRTYSLCLKKSMESTESISASHSLNSLEEHVSALLTQDVLF